MCNNLIFIIFKLIYERIHKEHEKKLIVAKTNKIS